MRIGLVPVVVLGLFGCSPSQPLSVGTVFLTRTVKASDSSGVGSVSCPTTMRVMGGGCDCKGAGDVLFGAGPAGNGFVCGCYDFGPAGGAVESVASCLGSDTAGSLKDGLEGPDEELEVLRQEFRQRRADRPNR